MLLIKKELQNRIRGTGKLAILGVGSEVRGDDAAGILIAKGLNREFPAQGRKKINNFKVFLGGTAPENLTGEIKQYAPTHILIIDSADFSQKAGSVKIIEPGKIGGTSFSTHRLPIAMVADYLLKAIPCKISIIGIQTKSVDFSDSVSAEVKESIAEVTAAIKEILGI